MKKRNWGLSSSQGYTSVLPSLENSISTQHHYHQTATEAVKDYREHRENGIQEDRPKYHFPRDGTFQFENPNEKFSKILYIPGPQAQEWMTKKDQNYLKRIAHFGTLEEKAQLASEVQGGPYEQYFADERIKFEEEYKVETDEKIAQSNQGEQPQQRPPSPS